MNVINWAKKYYGVTDDTQSIFESSNAFSFLFIWAIFEGEACGGYAKINQIKTIKNRFSNINILEIFSFFQLRYSNNKSKFDNLRISEQKIKQRTYNILTSKSPTKDEMTEALLVILFRFRNNIFHGNKKPLQWGKYDDCLCHLINFMIIALKNCRI